MAENVLQNQLSNCNQHISVSTQAEFRHVYFYIIVYSRTTGEINWVTISPSVIRYSFAYPNQDHVREFQNRLYAENQSGMRYFRMSMYLSEQCPMRPLFLPELNQNKH